MTMTLLTIRSSPLLALNGDRSLSSSRTIQRKRENAKHSLLGRLRLSYSRRGSTSSCPTTSDHHPSMQTVTTVLPKLAKEEASQPPPEQSEPVSTIEDNTYASSPPSSHKTKDPPVIIRRFRPINNGVVSGSLVGAKRRYVEMQEPSEDGCTSDDDSSSASTTDASASSHTKQVQFSSHCLVTEIPHYSEYSLQQRKQQWNGCKVIRLRARINTFEYRKDGWALEHAAEEDKFVEYEGQLYHPSHQTVGGILHCSRHLQDN